MPPNPVSLSQPLNEACRASWKQNYRPNKQVFFLMLLLPEMLLNSFRSLGIYYLRGCKTRNGSRQEVMWLNWASETLGLTNSDSPWLTTNRCEEIC